jgi:UDP-N-acetylglucosamine diphosphorylase/glucosamine-1-phosphate N-acetyltransferase
MNYIFFDDKAWNTLLPLTYTRPTAEIRIGILTISEKWKKHLDGTFSYLTQDYLSEKYPLCIESQNILINGSVCPTNKLIEAIDKLDDNSFLTQGDLLIAAKISSTEFKSFLSNPEKIKTIAFEGTILSISFPWEIFKYNGEAIVSDFELITKGRVSQPLGETNRAICPENIFIEEGATILFATFNASTGPIYIGKDAEVMEGSIVRGPFALCEHSGLKMAAKIYGPTTIGPYSKVGGEINNSVIFGYSNKAHDGFLGNSVLGEWCNLGADTNNSNLKNNYEEVKLWSYPEERFKKTGLQFCGLVMGDHSKSGINTMFNTGTVVGVSSNIFGDGFPRNFIPSFSWGGAGGFQQYAPNKAIEVAEKVYARRELQLTEIDKNILKHIHECDAKWRNF